MTLVLTPTIEIKIETTDDFANTMPFGNIKQKHLSLQRSDRRQTIKMLHPK